MRESTNKVSRRAFLTGAASAAGVVALGMAGCATGTTDEAPAQSNLAETGADWMPETWDYEADIVVVGLGGAGLGAAIAARQADLEVIALEAAPEEYCGGNTRVSGNYVLIPDDPKQGAEYQTALNGPYEVEPELVAAWAEALSENKEWLDDLDIILEETQFANPEFPDLPGCDSIKTYAVGGKPGHATLWTPMYEVAQDMDVNIMYDMRATQLIYDPATREVRGVIASDKAVKARKGVILACGGFENNPDMIRDYYPTEGAPKVLFQGTPYNRGDGVKMCQDIGAQLWHMNAFAGTSGPQTFAEGLDSSVAKGMSFSTKDWIYVNNEGQRFMYEEATKLARHGRVKDRGCWPMQIFPNPSFVIMGKNAFEGEFVLSTVDSNGWCGMMGTSLTDNNQGMLDAGIFVQADTAEELAEKLGLTPSILAETLTKYNEAVANGVDEEFDRGTEIISNFAFDFSKSGNENTAVGEGTVAVEAFALEALEPPFYAFEIRPGILNSQGGPKRNEVNQVLNVNDEPIPRLYAAGEFGTIYAYMYNGGGNVSDAVASGRVAARHCASLDSWE